MVFSQELLDELLSEYQHSEDLLNRLMKASIGPVLEGELEHLLGYSKNFQSDENSSNSRNGKGKKTLKTEDGLLAISVPSDRDNSIGPLPVKRGQTRFSGFDEKIVFMYASGKKVREDQDHLHELYASEVSL